MICQFLPARAFPWTEIGFILQSFSPEPQPRWSLTCLSHLLLSKWDFSWLVNFKRDPSSFFFLSFLLTRDPLRKSPVLLSRLDSFVWTSSTGNISAVDRKPALRVHVRLPPDKGALSRAGKSVYMWLLSFANHKCIPLVSCVTLKNDSLPPWDSTKHFFHSEW